MVQHACVRRTKNVSRNDATTQQFNTKTRIFSKTFVASLRRRVSYVFLKICSHNEKA
jgi:hypothetical protein